MRASSWLLELGRIAIGATFLISGLFKAIDPAGVGLKVREYLVAMLGIRQGATLALSDLLASTLIVIEFSLGAFLLMGIYRRLSTRFIFTLLLVFTLITGYNYASGSVSDCGCFGDVLSLSPLSTFLKNILLLPVSLVLMKKATSLKHLYSRREQWIPALVAIAGISYFTYFNLVTAPFLDLLPYKRGYNIRERIKQSDSIYQAQLIEGTRYIYEKFGQKRSYHMDSLPDSTWSYVGIAQAEEIEQTKPAYNFTILSERGEDIRDSLLNDGKGLFLLLANDWSQAKQTHFEAINTLYCYADSLGLKFYSVTSGDDEGFNRWRYETNAQYPSVLMDATVVKSIIRSNMGLVFIKDGQIIDKLPERYFPSRSEVQSFVQGRLWGEYYYTVSIARIAPLVLWGILLLIGVVRRLLRHRRACYYLKTEQTNNNI